MPSSSKSQQKFFGVVKSMQKGDIPKKGEAGKVAKSMKKKDVDDFASTKHKGLPNKMKQETKVRKLIRKMVGEIMKEDFGGTYPKEMRKKFDGKRRKQSEVLGYTLTGKDDIRTDIGDATIKEGLKRFSVYVSGQSKPLVLMGKDEKEVKQTAHMMLKNSSVKIRKVVKEGKLTEKAGEHGMAFAQYVVVRDSKGKMFNYNPKKKELEPFGGGKKMKLSQIDDKKFVKSLKKIRLEGKLSEAITGADRKTLLIFVREIVQNLKKAGAKKPSKVIGRGVLSIMRAMTYTSDNANYKQYKKYFPKKYNSKLVQKHLKNFHNQNDKVQVTLVQQAMNNVLGEGKLTEANKSLPPFEIVKRMMKSKYWNKAGKGFQEKVIKKFRGRGVTPKALDKWLPDYIDGREISKLFEGKLTEVSGVAVAQKVLKDKQRIKGIDLQTANLIVTIHKAYNKNKNLQKKFEKIPLDKMKQLVLKYYG